MELTEKRASLWNLFNHECRSRYALRQGCFEFVQLRRGSETVNTQSARGQTIPERIETSCALASGRARGIVQPLAAAWPPPPNIAATFWTSMPGLARIDTRVELPSISLSSAETRTPSIIRP